MNGQSTQTSSAGGDHNHKTFKYAFDYSGGWDAKKRVYWGENETNGIILETVFPRDITTASSSGNHSNSVTTPAHAHSISFPSHTHNFSLSIPNHIHQITIPNHTHQFTLPDHTHPLEWGIYEAPNSATSVDIIVDGKTIPQKETNQQRLNVIDHLRKTSSRKVARGKHTI